MEETSSSSTTNVSQILAENTQEGEEEIKRAAFRKRGCLPKSSSFEMQKGRRVKGKKANKAKNKIKDKSKRRQTCKRRKAEGGRRKAKATLQPRSSN